MQEDYQYLALCKWKAERTCRMEDHRSQDRRQKKKKVKIYTYRTAIGSAIENAEAGSAGELKCKIVVSNRRTHRQPELI